MESAQNWHNLYIILPPLIFPKKEAAITSGNSKSNTSIKSKKPYKEKSTLNGKKICFIIKSEYNQFITHLYLDCIFNLS